MSDQETLTAVRNLFRAEPDLASSSHALVVVTTSTADWSNQIQFEVAEGGDDGAVGRKEEENNNNNNNNNNGVSEVPKTLYYTYKEVPNAKKKMLKLFNRSPIPFCGFFFQTIHSNPDVDMDVLAPLTPEEMRRDAQVRAKGNEVSFQQKKK